MNRRALRSLTPLGHALVASRPAAVIWRSYNKPGEHHPGHADRYFPRRSPSSALRADGAGGNTLYFDCLGVHAEFTPGNWMGIPGRRYCAHRASIVRSLGCLSVPPANQMRKIEGKVAKSLIANQIAQKIRRAARTGAEAD